MLSDATERNAQRIKLSLQACTCTTSYNIQQFKLSHFGKLQGTVQYLLSSLLLTACFMFVTLCFICVQVGLRQSRNILMMQWARNASSRSQKQLCTSMALCPYPKMKLVSCTQYTTSVSLQQLALVYFVHVVELNFPHFLKSVHKCGQRTLWGNLKKEVHVNLAEQLLIIKPNTMPVCSHITILVLRWPATSLEKGRSLTVTFVNNWKISVVVQFRYQYCIHFVFFKCMFIVT